MDSKIRSRDIYDDGYCDGWWYCSDSAFIVKWVIVGVIFLIFFGWIIGGYIHARRRMKKGLPPMTYHRWLVSRRARAQFAPVGPPQNNFAYYNQHTGRYENFHPDQGYPMQSWVPPPPAYGAQGYVPPYPGATKVNPDQSYDPPSGPPPAAAQGSSSVRELETQAQNSSNNAANGSTPSAEPSSSQQATGATLARTT